MSEHEERRARPRFECEDVGILYVRRGIWIGKEPHICDVCDLSECGIRFNCDYEFEPMQEFYLELNVEHCSRFIDLYGRVVWRRQVDGKWQYGCMLYDEEKHLSKDLQRYAGKLEAYKE